LDVDLSSYCLEAELVKSKSQYSCLNCSSNSINISLGSTGIVDCFKSNDNLTLCLEGTADENRENQKCTKCIENAELNDSNICNCASDSFEVNNVCYKCDDQYSGNFGCLASKGCFYDLLFYTIRCNECKEGYYNNSYGICSPCSDEVPNCEKCHSNISFGPHNETIVTAICDSCSPLYTLKKENKTQKCELNECKEYPEISPGCIICKDKLNEYKQNNKCQTCKYGYFKTKEEKCVYCSSEQYGGPACYECGYEQDETGKDTDNIICKDCFSYFNHYSLNYNYNDNNEDPYFTSVLSSKKKCFNCQHELSDLCLDCEFVTDEELKCNLCPPGYYIDSEVNCISFAEKVETLPHCVNSKFNIGIYNFTKKNDDIDFEDKIQGVNLSDYNNVLSNAKYPISANCSICDDRYFFNNKSECKSIDYDKCIGKFIFADTEHRSSPCENLCDDNLMIYIKIKDNSMDLNPDNYKDIAIDYSYHYYNYDIITISNILQYGYNKANIETRDFLLNSHLCLNKSDEELVKKFEGCEKILYIPTNKSYICLMCYYEYFLDPESNKCIYNRDCEYENIGTNTTPIYSCIRCYNKYDILITGQNGIKTCFNINELHELQYCKEANITSTYYLDTEYNCTTCQYEYWPYYSKFYDRYICQPIFRNITKNKEISLEDFEEEDGDVFSVKNGICESGYFTPDGKNCYKFDSEIVGMPGCSGKCSFSVNRNKSLICESECKEGYIERSKGVCIPCKNAKSGCALCHYETNYPEDYIGVKRDRYVQCDKCDRGYYQDEKGDCHSCGSNCEKCAKNETFDSELNNTYTQYICTKCAKNYFLYENDDCEECFATRSVSNNKCVFFSDEINHCKYCESNKEKDGLKCKECDRDYVLDSDSNTCLKRADNKDLEKFKHCLEYKKENGKEICVRCKPQFSLIKKGDEVKCSYLPTLFDANFRTYYNYDFEKKHGYFSYNTEEIIKNDYYSRQAQFMPCKEAINIGTEENPLYSCSKCYNVFGDEDYIFYSYYYQDFYSSYYFYDFNNDDRYFGYMPVKINDKMTNTSYCMRYVKKQKIV